MAEASAAATAAPEKEAPAPEDGAAAHALLASPSNSLYLLPDELLRFADSGRNVIARIPLAAIERVAGHRLYLITPCLQILAGLLLFGFASVEDDVVLSWLLFMISVALLGKGYLDRLQSQLALAACGRTLSFVLDGPRWRSRAFVLSLVRLLEALKRGDSAGSARPDSDPATSEAQPLAERLRSRALLSDDKGRLFVLPDEVLLLHDDQSIIARVPLADIRAVRRGRRYAGGLLALLIALYLILLPLAHDFASLLDQLGAAVAGVFALAAYGRLHKLERTLVLELEQGKLAFPIDRSRAEIDVLVASFDSILRSQPPASTLAS